MTFTGVVRGDGGLAEMEIEHYPGMTERAIAAIRDEAVARWRLTDALVVHRYGPMRPGELIMMVATAARHRGDAFAAAEFLMDYLKSRAPFWKRERRAGGTAWVAQAARGRGGARPLGREPRRREQFGRILSKRLTPMEKSSNNNVLPVCARVHALRVGRPDRALVDGPVMLRHGSILSPWPGRPARAAPALPHGRAPRCRRATNEVVRGVAIKRRPAA